MNEKKPPVAQYVLLGLLFFVACAYQVRATICVVSWIPRSQGCGLALHNRATYWGPKAAFVGERVDRRVIHEGDILMAVKGRTFTGARCVCEAMAAARPGDSLRIITRDRTHRIRNCRDILLPASDDKGLALGARPTLKVVLPFFSIIAGFWVDLCSPRDMSAWLRPVSGWALVTFSPLLESWGRASAIWPNSIVSSPAIRLGAVHAVFRLYFPQRFRQNRAQTLVRWRNMFWPPS